MYLWTEVWPWVTLLGNNLVTSDLTRPKTDLQLDWLQDFKTRDLTWTLTFWLGMSWCPHPAQKFKGVLLKWLISLFSDTHALYQPSRSQSCCSAGVFVSAEQQTFDSFGYHLYTWSTTALQPEKHSATHNTAVISLSLNMIHFIGIIKIVK